METCLLQRLFTLANADEENLLQQLREIGAPFEAWQSLLSDVARTPESQLAHQLDALLSYCGEMSNLRTVLFNFLEHRGDWWARARHVVSQDSFASIFSQSESTNSYCEVPLLYRNAAGDTVYGVIEPGR